MSVSIGLVSTRAASVAVALLTVASTSVASTSVASIAVASTAFVPLALASVTVAAISVDSVAGVLVCVDSAPTGAVPACSLSADVVSLIDATAGIGTTISGIVAEAVRDFTITGLTTTDFENAVFDFPVLANTALPATTFVLSSTFAAGIGITSSSSFGIAPT